MEAKNVGNQSGKPNITPEEDKKNNNDSEPNKKRIENQKLQVAMVLFKRIMLLLLGYYVCYFDLSLTLALVTMFNIAWFEYIKSKTGRKIQRKIRGGTLTKHELTEIVKDLPSWVSFPDREKAEWLNEIIFQLWPSLNNYIIKYCRGKIQNNIKKKFESFRFEEIDFGNMPPKIDGVKVYKSTSKDSIIIDFEIFYDGDCDINFSVSGTQIGRIKDFQMGVDVRVVLKPILFKAPIVGGIQVFFLNVPEMQFELEGITGIPGFSFLVRQKIEEIINKKLVFPNKVTKTFSKSIEAAELKSIEAEGVLRVHVFEAKDLEKKDVTGKSDPYVVLSVGAQEHKTKVIGRDLNPQWDYYCEFIILDPFAQQLHFKVFDQDEFREDDSLGSGAVEISEVIKPGNNDQWITLDNVKRGKIHLRFSWLALSTDKGSIVAATEETKLLKIENIHTALLTIYIDSAFNLPKIKSYKKPDPFLILTVGKNQVKSRVKRHTCNPQWEQGFYLLVSNPENDSLIINILDKQSDSKLDKLVLPLNSLLNENDMQISKEEKLLEINPGSTITLSLQLRILHNARFEANDDDDDDEEDVLDDLDCEKKIEQQSTRIKPEAEKPDTIETKYYSGKSGETMEKIIHRIRVDEASQAPTVRMSNFIQQIYRMELSVWNLRIFFLRKADQLGQIELSISYSELRQKLLVTIHRVANIPLKDSNNIPDPYVKVRLNGLGNTNIKNRTKVVVDCCDPVFEDTFEYLLSDSELSKHRLIVTVKNKKFFNSSILGQVIIELKKLSNLDKPLRNWYDLIEAQESD